MGGYQFGVGIEDGEVAETEDIREHQMQQTPKLGGSLGRLIQWKEVFAAWLAVALMNLSEKGGGENGH